MTKRSHNYKRKCFKTLNTYCYSIINVIVHDTYCYVYYQYLFTFFRVKPVFTTYYVYAVFSRSKLFLALKTVAHIKYYVSIYMSNLDVSIVIRPLCAFTAYNI